MRRLFFRVYATLALMLVWVLALPWALGHRGPPVWSTEVDRVASFPEEAIRALSREVGDVARDRELAELSERFHGPVRLVPRAAVVAQLSDGERQLLERGQSVRVMQRRTLTQYVPLPAEPFVVVQGPLPPPGLAVPPQVWVLTGLLGMTGFAVSWMLAPLARQLRVVSMAAERLGDGDLSARVDLPEEAVMGPVGRAFDRMADQVRDGLEAREALLHAVSHELRTPIQRVGFAVELLHLAEDSAALRRRVDEVQADLEELDELVDELLSFSRLRGGSAVLQPTEIQLRTFLEGLVEDAGRLREGVSVELVPTDEGVVHGDRRQLKRAIGNLLSNAVRYGTRRVRLEVHREPGRWVIWVDDDGVGIAVGDRERIFEPFVRLDAARARDTGGVGLGLALARRIVDAHEGTLEVCEADLGGARFCLVLPEGPQDEGQVATSR